MVPAVICSHTREFCSFFEDTVAATVRSCFEVSFRCRHLAFCCSSLSEYLKLFCVTRILAGFVVAGLVAKVAHTAAGRDILQAQQFFPSALPIPAFSCCTPRYVGICGALLSHLARS